VAVDLDSVRTRGAGPTPETLVFAATSADAQVVCPATRPGASSDTRPEGDR